MEPLEVAPLGCGHVQGREPGAQGLELGHDLEHALQLLRRGQGHDRTAMRAHLDQTHGGELADRLADGRARDAEAAGEQGLVERRAGLKRPADDLVRQLVAQHVGARATLGHRRRRAVGGRGKVAQHV